jgi:hypothetical protein
MQLAIPVNNNLANTNMADRRCKLDSIADRFFIGNLLGQGVPGQAPKTLKIPALQSLDRESLFIGL